jgi:Gti1/Pac2 family transcription factor
MCSFPSPVQPTLTGYIASTRDATFAVEACLAGHLLFVPRRPNNQERTSSIKSGSVFIYEERMSGIKRWTDGLTWNPSRVLGDFLIYRELNGTISPDRNVRKLHSRCRVRKIW